MRRMRASQETCDLGPSRAATPARDCTKTSWLNRRTLFAGLVCIMAVQACRTSMLSAIRAIESLLVKRARTELLLFRASIIYATNHEAGSVRLLPAFYARGAAGIRRWPPLLTAAHTQISALKVSGRLCSCKLAEGKQADRACHQMLDLFASSNV